MSSVLSFLRLILTSSRKVAGFIPDANFSTLMCLSSVLLSGFGKCFTCLVFTMILLFLCGIGRGESNGEELGEVAAEEKGETLGDGEVDDEGDVAGDVARDAAKGCY